MNQNCQLFYPYLLDIVELTNVYSKCKRCAFSVLKIIKPKHKVLFDKTL